MVDFSIAKQPRQQGQGVLGEGRVDEWGLSLKGLNRATAWLSFIVEIRVTNLRVKFDRGTKA
jgi:hypothetical protein